MKYFFNTQKTFNLSSLPCHVNLLLLGDADTELDPLLVVAGGQLAHLLLRVNITEKTKVEYKR